MTEATAAQPALEPPRTLEQWIAIQCDLLARNLEATARVERLVRAAMTHDERTELVMAVRRQADIQGTMLDVDQHIAQAAVMRTFGETLERGRELTRQAELAAVPDPEPAPPRTRPAGHRKAERHLKGLPGWVAVPLGATGAALRHSWVAHPVATAATGLTAATLATAAVVAPHAGVVLPFGASTSSTPNPAASVVAATPVIPPSQIAAAITRPETGKGPGRTLSVLAPPAVPAYTQPAPVPPGSVPAPEPSSQQQEQPPAEGTLSVSTTTVDLGAGAGLQATLTLTASGGPVDWHLFVPEGLSASSRRGYLDDGGSVDVTISASAAETLAGSATLAFWPGREHVAVSWEAPADVPADTPTDLPTGLPSVAPTIPGA